MFNLNIQPISYSCKNGLGFQATVSPKINSNKQLTSNDEVVISSKNNPKKKSSPWKTILTCTLLAMVIIMEIHEHKINKNCKNELDEINKFRERNLKDIDVLEKEIKKLQEEFQEKNKQLEEFLKNTTNKNSKP